MKEQKWVFTFGFGHEHVDKYVVFSGSYGEAREKMFEKFGSRWAFQYSEEEWQKWVEECKKTGYPVETQMEIEE